MENWEVHVGEGIGPVRFGMTPAEVAGAVGGQGTQDRSSYWFLENAVRVSITDGRVTEISVGPHPTFDTRYKGHSFFAYGPEGLLRLLEEDGGQMYEDVGYILVPALGMMMTGVHDGDRAQLALTLSPEPMPASEYEDAEPVTARDLTKA